MEELVKYLPDWNEEGVEVNDLPENILSTRDEWPLLWEFAALNPKQHWCWGNEDPQSLHYLKTDILANAGILIRGDDYGCITYGVWNLQRVWERLEHRLICLK